MLLQPQRIVLPEALDPRILKAAAELLRRGQARIILLGQEKAVQVRFSNRHQRGQPHVPRVQGSQPTKPSIHSRYAFILAQDRQSVAAGCSWR